MSYICSGRDHKTWCSLSCAAQSPEVREKTEKTVLKKYGVKNVLDRPETRANSIEASKSEKAKEKRVATNLKRYGVDNPAKNDEIKKRSMATQKAKNGGVLGFNNSKQRETMLKRYGGPSPMASPEVRAKVIETQQKRNDGKLGFNNSKQKETMSKKYGGHGRLSDPDEVIRTRESVKAKYGVEWVSQHPPFKEKAVEALISKYGSIFNNHGVISKLNKDFAKTIKDEFNIEVEFEKAIAGKIYDLYLPASKILVELNPTITHNSSVAFACLKNSCQQPCEKHKALSHNYHQEKSIIARENSFNLIHVYDWNTEEEILKILKSKLRKDEVKISARKCNLKKISQKEANKFLNEHHIQGGAAKQTVCYGLFLREKELIAVATFGKSRFNKNYEWEWLRFAVKENHQIHGGAGRIFKEFVKKHNPQTVVSYIDLDHTTLVTFLDHLNFTQVKMTSPRLYWHHISDNKTIAQTSLNMLGADRLLGTSYGPLKNSGLNSEEHRAQGPMPQLLLPAKYLGLN